MIRLLKRQVAHKSGNLPALAVMPAEIQRPPGQNILFSIGSAYCAVKNLVGNRRATLDIYALQRGGTVNASRQRFRTTRGG